MLTQQCTTSCFLLVCLIAWTQLAPVSQCCPQTVKGAYNKVTGVFTKAKKAVTSAKPKYIGCYTDRDDSRDVQFIGAKRADMKVSVCNNICKEKYPMVKFFAVQNGNLCFCGNDYGNYKAETDGHCDKPCTGNPDEKCGGELLNSIYEIL